MDKVPVDIEFYLKNMNFEAEAQKIKSGIKGVSNSVNREADQMTQMLKRASTAAGVYFSAYYLKDFLVKIGEVRGEFQQLDIALTTILKSKEKADALMEQVVQFAALTPFDLKDVAKGTKQLLAYSFSAEGAVDNLRMLGDVASGVSQPIGDIIYLYGTLKAQGRAYWRDIYQFANRGIPIYAELAKVMGIAEDEVQAYVEAGKIGFPEVEKVFKSMTSEGGMFANLTEKQAQSITGLASNFEDALTRMYNSLGQSQEGAIAGAIKTATNLVDNYEDVFDILKVLIATYGTYKAAVIAASVASKLSMSAGNIQAWFQLARGIKTAKDARIAFNLASSANPWGLALAGIAALITALIVFNKKTDEASSVSAEFKSNLQGEVTEIKKAFNAIKDSKEGTEARTKAIDEVNTKYKEYLPNLVTEISKQEDLKIALDAVTTSMAKNLAFKAQESQLSKSKGNVDDDLENFYERINKASSKLTNEQKGQFAAAIEQYKEQAKESFKKLGYATGDTFGISQIFSKISGGKEIGSFAVSNLDFAIKGLIKSEQELEERSANLKTTYNSYLDALGFGDQPPADPAVNKTIKKQIEETQSLLDEAKAKLKEMRSADSEATIKQIEGQDQAVKDLTDKLGILTGVTEKVQKDADKSKKEHLDAMAELNQKELDLMIEQEAAKVAILSEGADKLRAEADLNYKKQLAEIDKKQVEHLKTYNLEQGFKPGDKGYINALPEQIKSQYDDLRIKAEQKKAKEIEKINEDSAKVIKDIMSESHAVFMTELAAETEAIETKYAEKIKVLKEQGASAAVIADAEKAKIKEIENANVKTLLNELAMSEEIEMQRAELNTKGYNRDIEIERKRLLISQKFARLKIDTLKATGKTEYKQDIELLELFIKNSDNLLNNLGIKEANDDLGKTLGVMSQLSELVGSFDSDLGDALQKSVQLATAFDGIIKGLSKDGDPLSVISGAITIMATLFDNSAQKQKDIEANAKRIDDLIQAQNFHLEQQIKLLETVSGDERSKGELEVLSTIQRQIKELDQLAKGMGLMVTQTTAWSTSLNKVDVSGIEDMIKQLRAYTGDQSEEFQLFGGVKFNVENLADATELIDKYEKLLDERRSLLEEMTQTSSKEIADMFALGFASGKLTAADFADDLESMLKAAITESFRTKYLLTASQAFFDQFAALTEGGVTTDEIEKLKELWTNFQGDAAAEWEKQIAGMSALGIDFGSDMSKTASGLAGAVRREMDQETGSQIAGIMRKDSDELRLHGMELIKTNQHLNTLTQEATKIAANTAQTVIELREMQTKLYNIQENTKPAVGRDL